MRTHLLLLGPPAAVFGFFLIDRIGIWDWINRQSVALAGRPLPDFRQVGLIITCYATAVFWTYRVLSIYDAQLHRNSPSWLNWLNALFLGLGMMLLEVILSSLAIGMLYFFGVVDFD